MKQMLKECSKMHSFKHPNVLNLTGVCLDGGPNPYIIMPFMVNGSLLAYLKKNRGKLVVSCKDDNVDEVHYAVFILWFSVYIDVYYCNIFLLLSNNKRNLAV